MQENLYGKTLDELQEICKLHALPSFTAKQITDWLYKKHCRSFDEMSNLSLKVREILKTEYIIRLSSPVGEQISADGTKKYLFTTVNNHFIETVFIPDNDRATVCVSSQAGCKMNCLFCMTGKQGFQENLSTGEILNQIRSLPEFDKLTNIVFMGMGEPFDNYETLLKALTILTSEWGYAWSPRRITVSTIGIIPILKRFIKESECHLAVSLHSAFPENRLQIMPLEKSYPMHEIIRTLKQHNWHGQRRLSFEYIMFAGINDTLSDCRELIRLLKGLECQVNLIRYHNIPEINLKGVDYETMLIFRDTLNRAGILTTVRVSRGEDIMAACGMLSGLKSPMT